MPDNSPTTFSRSLNWLLGFGLILALIVIWWRSGQIAPGYAYQQNMAQAAAATATALLAIALFVERGMAVVNALVFGDQHREAEAQLVMGDPVQGMEQMKDVLGKKERVRLFGSFIAALFISAAGVRTLEGLLVTTGANIPANALLFPVDVVLTAALIAGGSNGLAFLIQAIKDQLTPPDPVEPVEPVPGQLMEGPAPAAAPTRAAIRSLRTRLTTTG